MATKTLGTNGTTSLTAINAASGPGTGTGPGEHPDANFLNFSVADFATVQELIKNDKISTHPIYPGGLTQRGLLYVPNRGILKLYPGDWVGVDSFGWPILVSADSIAYGSTSWTHS